MNLSKSHDLWKALNVFGENYIPFSKISYTVFQKTGRCHLDERELYDTDKTIPMTLCEEFYSVRRANDNNQISTFTVCDGHNGSFTAKLLTNELLPSLGDSISELSESNQKKNNEIIKRKFLEINEELNQRYRQNESNGDQTNEDDDASRGINSGSTALSVLINQDCYYIANVGDTAAILCRSGKAEKLTVDHNVSKMPKEERQLLREKGLKIHDDHISNSGFGGVNIYRGFGDYPIFSGEEHFCLPSITCRARSENDEFLLLTTDGVPSLNYSSQAIVSTILEKLQRGCSTSEALDAVYRKAKKNGSRDDVTLILILFHPNEVAITIPTQNKVDKTQLKTSDINHVSALPKEHSTPSSIPPSIPPSSLLSSRGGTSHSSFDLPSSLTSQPFYHSNAQLDNIPTPLASRHVSPDSSSTLVMETETTSFNLPLTSSLRSTKSLNNGSYNLPVISNPTLSIHSSSGPLPPTNRCSFHDYVDRSEPDLSYPCISSRLKRHSSTSRHSSNMSDELSSFLAGQSGPSALEPLRRSQPSSEYDTYSISWEEQDNDIANSRSPSPTYPDDASIDLECSEHGSSHSKYKKKVSIIQNKSELSDIKDPLL